MQRMLSGMGFKCRTASKSSKNRSASRKLMAVPGINLGCLTHQSGSSSPMYPPPFSPLPLLLPLLLPSGHSGYRSLCFRGSLGGEKGCIKLVEPNCHKAEFSTTHTPFAEIFLPGNTHATGKHENGHDALMRRQVRHLYPIHLTLVTFPRQQRKGKGISDRGAKAQSVSDH